MSAAPAPPPFPGVDLSVPFKGIYTSTYICAGLWGIITMQMLNYYLQYRRDAVYLKVFVFWVWGLTTAHQALLIRGLARPLLSGWGNIEVLGSAIPELLWQILLTGLMSCSVQWFFTYRLWKYNGRKLDYTLILVPAAMSQLVADIVYVYGAVRQSADSSALKETLKFERAAIAANSIAVGVDIIIALLMGFKLLKDRTGFAQTDRMLMTIFSISVSSGAWTAAVAIVALVASLKLSLLDYAAIYICLVPFYAITVLGNINARDFIRSKGAVQTDDMYMSPFSTRAGIQNSSTFPFSAQVEESVTQVDYFVSDKDSNENVKVNRPLEQGPKAL